MLGFTKAALAVAVLASSAAGQGETDFLQEPMQLWVQGFAPMLDNNGIVVSADDSTIFATSATGRVAAMKRDGGEYLWDFPIEGGFCNGEVTFSPNGTTLYHAASVGETCTVYAKTAATGDDVWTSDPLDGVCEGSAHATSDGLNVFVIHNTENGTLGHFTVLDETGAVYYTYDDTVGPYAPMGFYPDPSPGGNFPNGTGNTNSFAIWGYKPTPGATDAERSGTLAFQMPISTIVASPTVTVLINATLLDWRSTAPPLLAAMGQEMFWSVTSSQLKGWTNTTFVNGPNGGANFGRGLPVWVAAPYTPAVNDIDAPTIVCGGSANSSFSCMEPTVSELFYTPSFTNDITPGLIYADPFFSTSGDRVYFFDHVGVFHSIDPTDGSVFFNASTGVSIQANAAMTSDGAYIFFGDTTGNILAWQIAESTLSEVTSPPGSSGGGGETESPSSESSSPNMTPTPDGPSSPTSAPGPTSGAVSMTVFSVIAVSAVTAAATTFF